MISDKVDDDVGLMFEGIDAVYCDYNTWLQLVQIQDDEQSRDSNNPEHLCHLKMELEKLPSNVKEVIRLLLNPPDSLAESIVNRKGNHRFLTLTDIKRYLVDVEGWRKTDINRALRKMKKFILLHFFGTTSSKMLYNNGKGWEQQKTTGGKEMATKGKKGNSKKKQSGKDTFSVASLPTLRKWAKVLGISVAKKKAEELSEQVLDGIYNTVDKLGPDDGKIWAEEHADMVAYYDSALAAQEGGGTEPGVEREPDKPEKKASKKDLAAAKKKATEAKSKASKKKAEAKAKKGGGGGPRGEKDEFGFLVGSKKSEACAMFKTGKHTMEEVLKKTQAATFQGTLSLLKKQGWTVETNKNGKIKISK